jgi:uncharacterized membrane protein YbaN (DUF454 family)
MSAVELQRLASKELMLPEQLGVSGGEAARSVAKGAARFGWVTAGHLCVALGLVGALLPLLPTTVFIIGAAACYARGSQRFYDRLLAHRLFGPIVRDWRERRGMSAGAKYWAIVAITITISASILALDTLVLRIVLMVVALVLIGSILRVPTVATRTQSSDETQDRAGS